MPKDITSIRIDFIPNSQQRYETAGDWYYEGDTLILKVSKTEDPLDQQLIALHELVEALLCNHAGITQEVVDKFDMGPGKDLEQPGDDPSAPYYEQHKVATNVERVVEEAMRFE